MTQPCRLVNNIDPQSHMENNKTEVLSNLSPAQVKQILEAVKVTPNVLVRCGRRMAISGFSPSTQNYTTNS